MRRISFAVVAAFGMLVGGQAVAQQCGQAHTLRTGETIFDLAEIVYGDPEKWSAIYSANRSARDYDPAEIPPGLPLRLPCLNASDDEFGLSYARRDRDNSDLDMLTGGAYAPFTDPGLEAGGMITEIVDAAFELAPSPVTFSVTWEDDWSRHLDPLLLTKSFDMGFPWFKPNCEDNWETFRCKNFHFSEPVFEHLIMAYVRKDAPINFKRDSDVEGKTLCRPKGYFTHDLDRRGREWLTRGVVRLVRPNTPADCFELLAAGDIDGVTINEFTGKSTILQLGLTDEIVAEEQPISIQGMHLVIAKTHPRGTTFLYRFNAGLQRLRTTERYQRIIDRHLARFWNEQENASVNTN